jgi:RNA polymerase sigma-70 factor (ECF subfamily)
MNIQRLEIIGAMPNDNALMLQVQQGKLGVLAELFEHNHVALYHYFLRMGNSPAQSEDLVQDTFMKVMVYRDSFNGSASFKAWLYGIARNTAADQFRKSQRWPESKDPSSLEQAAEKTLHDEIERQQRHDRFAQALALLPTELREILVLHRYQQLQYDEIAALLNCNLNTLKARMRKAVHELHQQYATLTGEASA